MKVRKYVSFKMYIFIYDTILLNIVKIKVSGVSHFDLFITVQVKFISTLLNG